MRKFLDDMQATVAQAPRLQSFIRNPSTENFFGIVSALEKTTRVTLRVTAKHA